MIEVKELRAGFGKKEILRGIDLVIPEKKIIAVVGQSGCGKTTFLKSLNRILEEEGGYIKGQILLDGENVMKFPKTQLRKRIGIVFQQPIAFPYSIERNLTYVLKYHYQLNKEQMCEKCVECLKKARLY